MPTTDKGTIAIASLFMGDAVVPAFNQANSRIGVGDSSAAFASNQVDLQGSNKFRKLVSIAPVRTANTIDYKTTFQPGEASFAWNELALFDSPAGDYMATRRTIAGFGTKPAGEAWTITLTVITAPI
jgi:hypothetical protein